MNDKICSFISDLLHRRGLEDRDGFALRAAVAITKARSWDEAAIKSAILRVSSELMRQHRIWPRQKVVELVTSRVIRKWPSPPLEIMSPKKIKILFVASNPVRVVGYNPANNVPLTYKPLALDHEFREVKAKLRSSRYRHCFQLIFCPAAQPDDLLETFNEERPHIVHFSGHGYDTGELIMLDEYGGPKPVSKKAIESLFRVMRDNIRVVVLNACFSKGQAAAITKCIDCAIGMKKEIGDRAAIKFAASFYRALGYGRSVKEAFKQGLVSLRLEGIEEDAIPSLMCRKGCDPAKMRLLDK